MDSTKEVVKAASDDQQGFFQTVFKLDEMDKDTLMNLVQYAILAVIPSMVILKVLRNFVPEDDETKGSIEITGEVALEVVFIVISLWFMNRVIRYVPTYSGRSYPDSDPFTPLMPFLLVLFTLQSKLGSKLNILMDRCVAAYSGESPEVKEQARGNGAVRVTQPLAGVHQPSQSDSFTTQNILPSDRGLTAMPPVGGAQMQPQQSPDFNDMYYNNPTPMPGAATPGMDMMGGPLAANEALGGFAKW
jgi:hypothetical protein